MTTDTMTYSKISKPQMKKIYATARQMGWTNEMLHTSLMDVMGKNHISDLLRTEARSFIDELVRRLLGQENKGYRADKKGDDQLRSEGMILGCTPAQCDKVRFLMAEAGWTEGRLRGYFEQFGAERLEDLTRTMASNLIEYLKSEIRRREIL